MTEVVYAHELWKGESPSIFLAGPSPRNENDPNWRPEAIEHLKKLGFKGAIFVPLPRDNIWASNYEKQVRWEVTYLHLANVIAFWIPRDNIKLPGFTTNVEFGEYLKSKKIILGYPRGATKMKYLHYRARLERVPITHTLEETMRLAVTTASGK